MDFSEFDRVENDENADPETECIQKHVTNF